jgi:PRTRC genetic system protein B
MIAHVDIEGAAAFELQQALLIYECGSHALATLHEILKSESGPPALNAGRPVSMAFLRKLSRGLGQSLRAEVLPSNLLARTPEMIVWWAPAGRRRMFFGKAAREQGELSGHLFPHPPLVFKLEGRELWVRALRENSRPLAKTELMVAPYWNTAQDGLVCQGTMRVPGSVSLETYEQWEAAYFASEFTHPSGAVRLTTYRQGFAGLWKSLRERTVNFPSRYLAPAKETLAEFVGRSGR